MQNLSSTDSLRKAISQAARPIALIGAVGGFIGDIIQPLGDFALWIAVFSLIAAILSFIWLLILRRNKPDIWDSLAAGLLVLFAGSFVVFSFWAIVFATGPERGYLATNVEPIGQLQAQLLGLQRDVTEIKDTTKQTATRVAEQSALQAEQVTRQAEANQVQSVAATAQARGFADLQSQFAALQRGNLVDNPTTPQEWYSNARLYQLKGDTTNAIRAYEGYFQYNLDFVDPYLEYSDLLKASEGLMRARELIAARAGAARDKPALELASTRLLDDAAERLTRYNALAARAPQFGPVFHELGLEYDRAIGALPTADLLKKQAEAYDTLLQLEKDVQGYTRYFIDKSLAEKNLTAAKQRLDAFANARRVTGQIDAIVMQYNDGMDFIVILSEAGVQKILFEIDNPKPSRETGTVSLGANTVPNANIGRIQLPVGDHTLYIQYIDANGQPSAIFEKPFKVRQVFANFNQQPVDFSTNTYPVTFLIGYAGALIEQLFTYKWSIDSDALDNTLPGAGMAAIQTKGLKQGDHVLYLQAVDDKGKQSEVERVPFTVK